MGVLGGRTRRRQLHPGRGCGRPRSETAGSPGRAGAGWRAGSGGVAATRPSRRRLREDRCRGMGAGPGRARSRLPGRHHRRDGERRAAPTRGDRAGAFARPAGRPRPRGTAVADRPRGGPRGTIRPARPTRAGLGAAENRVQLAQRGFFAGDGRLARTPADAGPCVHRLRRGCLGIRRSRCAGRGDRCGRGAPIERGLGGLPRMPPPTRGTGAASRSVFWRPARARGIGRWSVRP